MPQIAQQDYLRIPFENGGQGMSEFPETLKKQILDAYLKGNILDVVLEYSGGQGTVETAKILSYQVSVSELAKTLYVQFVVPSGIEVVTVEIADF